MIKIGVVGAGTMGSGIALAALLADFPVTLYDVAPEMLARAESYIRGHLSRKGKEAALAQLTLSGRLEDLAGSEVVIEAAPEQLPLKEDIFSQLDAICPPPAILATNTSTLPVTAIAAATQHPARVGGMHFFNPAPVLPLVEVGRGAQTAEETVERLVALARQMGKTPVVTRDTPGFIVNRVARPFYLEALRLLGEGAAGHEQIDQVVQLGGGFRMGPFRLMDLIGIDINFAVAKSLYEQTYGEPRYRPHWLQAQQVQQKALGRKSGQGFYRYDDNSSTPEMPALPPLSQQAGAVHFSPGDWAPGLAELCRQTGYTLAPEVAEPAAAFVVAGGPELRDYVSNFDRALPPDIPLICQAADTTVAEIATWLAHPERLVGFDGLFCATGQAATLVASPVLSDEIRQAAEQFFTDLGRHGVWIEDSPALILPRIVGMLINEAAFAAGEGVAETETIDLAMKLGVNYPKGPFAWAKELGYGKVVAVLDHLYDEYHEERYRVAPLLRRLARVAQLS
jgi:3-hydroxybutyryl-CoA dehydrogenase